MPSAARPEALPVCAPSCHTTAKQPRTTQAARKGAQTTTASPPIKTKKSPDHATHAQTTTTKPTNPTHEAKDTSKPTRTTSPPPTAERRNNTEQQNATTHPTNAPHNTPYKISPRLMVKDLLNASNVSASISSEGRPFHNPTLRTPKNLRYNSVRQGGTRSNLCPRARASGATVTSSRNSPASPSTT